MPTNNKRPRQQPQVVQLRIVPPAISQATVDVSQRLLSESLSGELVGLAWIEIRRDGFFVNAVGEAKRRPHLTQTMLIELEDLLRALR